MCVWVAECVCLRVMTIVWEVKNKKKFFLFLCL